MTEAKKEDQITLDEKARADALPEDMQIDTGEETDQVRTPGWKVFDFLVHGGINGVLNITASIVMAKDRANYNINKAIDGRKNIFGDGLNVSESDRKKTYLTNLFGLNFYDFSDWLDSQFYNKDANNNVKAANDTGGQDFSKKRTLLQRKGGFFGWLEDGAVGKIPVISNLLKPLGKYTGSILFLSWGGHITNSLMWAMESPSVKPKLVKALDRFIDKISGKQLNEHELKERKKIYHKLDTDLSGKSLKGIWGARFAGIGTIISVASIAEAIDVAITGGKKADGTPNNQLGLLRISQGVFSGMRKTQSWYNNRPSTKTPWNPAALNTDQSSKEAAVASYMLDQSVTEVAGTGITTSVQYLYLMMQEFFGIGPKTNIGDKDKKHEKKSAKDATAKKPKAKIDFKVEKPVEERSVSKEELEKDYTKARAKDFESKKTQDGVTYTNKTRKHDRESLKDRKSDSYEDAVSNGHLSRKESELEAAVV